MINLFKEYKDSGKIPEALLIGRNMVNKDPGNIEKVKLYLELLLNLSDKLPCLEDKKNFLGQANITLAFFEENADLSMELIECISIYKQRIDIISNEINQIELKENNDSLEEIKAKNTNQIKALSFANDRLLQVTNQDELDKVLQEITKIDSFILHNYLTEEQKNNYNFINKTCTSNISDKMQEIEYKDNILYNKEAINAYHNAFINFKEEETKYKNQTLLFSLVSDTLFAYDARRLFNETLIYYNHIYSYIFSKLDDEGKYALTRFSLQCERKSR